MASWRAASATRAPRAPSARPTEETQSPSSSPATAWSARAASSRASAAAWTASAGCWSTKGPPWRSAISTGPAAVSEPRGFWAVVRDAVRGTSQDYTEGPIGRAIVLLAIPMVLEMAMESIFAVVDVFWVSRLGSDAVATVGLTESILTLVYTAAMGLSIGVAAVVARRIGEKRPDAAAEAAVQGITLGLGVAAVVAVLGITLAPRLPAVATTIGRGTGVLYQLYRLTRGDARVAVRRIHLALRPAVMATLLRLSGSGTFQVLVGTASYIGLVRIMSTFGSAALAGYTIAIRIVIFALLPSWGLSNAAATMVGQSLGAAQPARAERAVWIAGGYNMLVLGLVGTVFVVLAGPIVGLFTHDPTAAPTGALALRTISYGFLFYALGMVLTQSFNGAGDTWTPTWINLGCFWLWEIPLAYVLSRVLDFGPEGVFLAITVAYSTLALVSVVLFRRGRWKLRAV